jgi:hypothetical protein
MEMLMRTFFVLLTVLTALVVLAAAPPAHALSVGAPVRTLEGGGFSLSGSIAYTKMDVRDSEVDSKSFFFKGAFAGGNRLMPYLKLGFADLEMGSFKGSMDFAYGGGVLFDLVTQEGGSGFRASLDAQVVWADSSEGGSSRDLMESQLSLLGSATTGGTTTYAGISSSFIDISGGGVNESENGQAHLFFGVDYYMDYNFYFNAEAHLFGQDMLSVGVGYQF